MKLKNMLIVFGIVGLFSNIAYPANAQRQLTTKETEAKYAGEYNQATATQLLNKEGKDIYFNKQEPKITKEEATKNAYALMFRGTSHLETSLKYEGNNPYYESIFDYKTMKISAKVDGLTGVITEIKALSMESKNLKAPNLYVKDKDYIAFLNKEKAEQIAINLFKDKKIKDTTLSVYAGYWEHIVKLTGNDDKATVIIDAENGKIIEVNYSKDNFINKQEPKITKEEATKNAYALMFRGTSHLETSLKYEGSKPYYESIFTYRTMRILAEVDGLTGKVTEINALSMESKNLQALNLHVKDREYIPSLNKGKAEEIALNFFKDTKVKDTTLSVYKGYWEYIVELIGNGDKAILIVDPENGKIIEVNYKINKEPVITPPTEVKPENKDILSKEEVIKIVLAKVPNGKVVEIELEKDDGKYIYEIEVMDDKYEYEFEIDAKTGKILDVDKDEIDED